MKKLDSVDVGAIIIIALMLTLVISISVSLKSCTAEIEQKGLKSIFHEIWEGKK